MFNSVCMVPLPERAASKGLQWAVWTRLRPERCRSPLQMDLKGQQLSLFTDSVRSVNQGNTPYALNLGTPISSLPASTIMSGGKT